MALNEIYHATQRDSVRNTAKKASAQREVMSNQMIIAEINRLSKASKHTSGKKTNTTNNVNPPKNESTKEIQPKQNKELDFIEHNGKCYDPDIYSEMGLFLSNKFPISETAHTKPTSKAITIPLKAPSVTASVSATVVDFSGAAKFIGNTDKRNLKDINGNFVDNKYGHLKYKECKESDLYTFPDTGIQVHEKAAEAFKLMQAAAKEDGIYLQIVSGFRSTETQKRTFAKKLPERNIENATEAQIKNRAKWSAPSGYSEHHTGLAIDINDTESRFANTKAYQWLKKRAKEFGFELSFKENNSQGIGFEPWHWRYVGDKDLAATFNQARELM